MSASADRAASHPMNGVQPWRHRNGLPERGRYVYRPDDPRRAAMVRRILDDIRARGGERARPEPEDETETPTARQERLQALAALRLHNSGDNTPAPGTVTAAQAAMRLGVDRRTIERYKRDLRTEPVQEPQPAGEPPRCERCGYLVTWCPCPEGPLETMIEAAT